MHYIYKYSIIHYDATVYSNVNNFKQLALLLLHTKSSWETVKSHILGSAKKSPSEEEFGNAFPVKNFAHSVYTRSDILGNVNLRKTNF